MVQVIAVAPSQWISRKEGRLKMTKVFDNSFGLNEERSQFLEIAKTPRFLRFCFFAFMLVALAVSSASWAQSDEPPRGKEAWERFRAIAPHHIQDWVISGEGPSYTLIYSEPPPAYDRDGYEALF